MCIHIISSCVNCTQLQGMTGEKQKEAVKREEGTNHDLEAMFALPPPFSNQIKVAGVGAPLPLPPKDLEKMMV